MTQTLNEQISELIESQVAIKVHEALTTYAEIISVYHKISLPLLLRDLPDPTKIGNSTSICTGVKRDGSRCNKTGKYEGYCLAHLYQRKKIQPIQVCQEGPEHNHGAFPSYSVTCPACVKCEPPPKIKLLIDLKGLI